MEVLEKDLDREVSFILFLLDFFFEIVMKFNSKWMSKSYGAIYC